MNAKTFEDILTECQDKGGRSWIHELELLKSSRVRLPGRSTHETIVGTAMKKKSHKMQRDFFELKK